MFQRMKEKLRSFIEDPLGTAIEWAIYLVMLGVGIAILVWAVRYVFGMLQ